MPFFLSKETIYRILQRELPEGVYPDGAATGFYSTAEQMSVAKTIESAYRSQESVYDNYFPQYADEMLPYFEEAYLGRRLDSGLTVQQRRDAVINKIRTQRRCTPADIEAVVSTVVPADVLFEVVEWGCEHGGWILDFSQLEIETILNSNSGLTLTGTDLCGKTAGDFGLTETEFLEMREEAYTYEVRIYGYTLTAIQLQDLEKVLLEVEPARSRHVITDGLDPNDYTGGST